MGVPETNEHIVVECPCGKRLKAPTSAIGRKAKCPKCGNIMVVQAPPPPREEGDLDFNAIYDIAEKEAQLAAEQEAKAPSAMRCPGCGSALTAGAVVCVACGYDMRTKRKLAPKSAAAAPVAPLPEKGKRGGGGWFAKAAKKDPEQDAPAASGNVFLGIGLGIAGAVLGAMICFFVWYKAPDVPFTGWLVLLVGAAAGFGVDMGYKAGTHFAGAIAAGITLVVVVITKFGVLAAFVAPTVTKVAKDVSEEIAVTRDPRVLQMLVVEEAKKQNVAVPDLNDEDGQDREDDADGSEPDAQFDKLLQVRREARKRLRDMPEAEYRKLVAKADVNEQVQALVPVVTKEVLKERGISTGWFGDDAHRNARAEAKKRVEAMTPEARKEAIQIAKEKATEDQKREMEAQKKEREELKAQEEQEQRQKKLASKSQDKKDKDEDGGGGGGILGFAIIMVLAFAIWAMIPTFVAMSLAWKIAANA